MQSIPGELGEITTGWLSQVLKSPVRAHRVLDAHDGTTGRAVLELRYAGATQLPGQLFVKLPPTDELQRAFVMSSGMGQREARFYRALSAELPVRLPRCYYADCDDHGQRYIMLLEHLTASGCSFRNASSVYSLGYVQRVLAAFARLHAAYWDSPRFAGDLAWVQPPLQHEIGVGLVGSALSRHGGDMPPVFRELAQLYLDDCDAVHQLWQQGPLTLIHGDVHDGNLFLDRGEPGFLDWALVARGPVMRDVGYFLAGTLAPEHRVLMPALLDYYRDALRADGIQPPSHEELWRQCQWHAAYVWVGAVSTLAMGDAWQPVNYMKASLTRLHGALDELGTVAALRAAL